MRRSASTTAIRITRRWKLRKRKIPSSSNIARCAKTLGARENFAAAWVSLTKCACAGRRRFTRTWNAPFARRGASTAARTRWPTEFLSRAKMASLINSRLAKSNLPRLPKAMGVRLRRAGGGGYWNPIDRPARPLLADWRSGYVSLASARRDYGVVIHQQGRRFELDVGATAMLRRQMAPPTTC